MFVSLPNPADPIAADKETTQINSSPSLQNLTIEPDFWEYGFTESPAAAG